VRDSVERIYSMLRLELARSNARLTRLDVFKHTDIPPNRLRRAEQGIRLASDQEKRLRKLLRLEGDIYAEVSL
jgi:hypothetical protein